MTCQQTRVLRALNRRQRDRPPRARLHLRQRRPPAVAVSRCCSACLPN